mgnify:FL=1
MSKLTRRETIDPGMVECPDCAGFGGWVDYFGEYDECSACSEEGQVTPEQAQAFHEMVARIEAQCVAEGMEREREQHQGD